MHMARGIVIRAEGKNEIIGSWQWAKEDRSRKTEVQSRKITALKAVEALEAVEASELVVKVAQTSCSQAMEGKICKAFAKKLLLY